MGSLFQRLHLGLAPQVVLPAVLLLVVMVGTQIILKKHEAERSLLSDFEQSREGYQIALDQARILGVERLADKTDGYFIKPRDVKTPLMDWKLPLAEMEADVIRPAYNSLDANMAKTMRRILFCDGETLKVQYAHTNNETAGVAVGAACDSPAVKAGIADFLEKGETAEPVGGFLAVGDEVVFTRYFPMTKYDRKIKGRVLVRLVRSDMIFDPTLASIKDIAGAQSARVVVGPLPDFTVRRDAGFVTVVLPLTGLEGGPIGFVELKKDITAQLAAADQAMMVDLGILIGSFVLLMGAVILVVRWRALTPMKRMTEVAQVLAHGDFSQQVPYQDRRDEIGNLAEAIEIFRRNGQEKERLEAEHKEHAEQAERERKAAMRKLADGFETACGEVVASIATAADNVRGAASTMSAVAARTADEAQTAASTAHEASSNVQTVATATEELSSSIEEIARQVANSSQITLAAVEEAQRTKDTVGELAEAAKKIGEVVSLITDIADQTNLLALNATIEAARAGDAGKGFAVVASEVKNLANQTAKATEQIGAQIGDIQSVTDRAVSAIQSISGTIAKVNEIGSTIASAVEEQGAATQEIARNVEGAASGTEGVSSRITTVSQLGSEGGEAAAGMSSAAENLGRQERALREAISGFLAKIRADAGDAPHDLITWSNRLATGEAFIDQDHKKLIDMINSLYRAMTEGKGRQVLSGILDGLEAYVVEHFGREEKAMDRTAYPEAEAHRRQHKAFLEKVASFRRDFDAGKGPLGPDVLDYLANWLSDHIQKTDRALGDHLGRKVA